MAIFLSVGLVFVTITCFAAGLARATPAGEPALLAVCAPRGGAAPGLQLTLLGTWTPTVGLTDLSQSTTLAPAMEAARSKKWYRLSDRGQAAAVGTLPGERTHLVAVDGSVAEDGIAPAAGRAQRLLLGTCATAGELFATRPLVRAPRPSQEAAVWNPMADWLSKQVLQATSPQDPQAHRQAELSFKNPQGRSLGGGFTEVTLPFALVVHRFPGVAGDLYQHGVIWGVFGRSERAALVTAGGVSRLDGCGAPPSLDLPQPRTTYAGLADSLWALALTQKNDVHGTTYGATSVIIDAADQAHVMHHVLATQATAPLASLQQRP